MKYIIETAFRIVISVLASLPCMNNSPSNDIDLDRYTSCNYPLFPCGTPIQTRRTVQQRIAKGIQNLHLCSKKEGFKLISSRIN